MEDLTEQLAGSFQVSNEPNTTAAPHPRFSDYKAKTPGLADQEKRRKNILEHQKKKRFDFQNHIRRLTDDFWEDLSDGEENEEEMEIQSATDHKPFRKPGRYYKNQLMYSEWMIELPEDFETEWIMVPCPVGKRNLVVASNGRTATFSKGGWPINHFQCNLPGGSKNVHKWHTESAILDCIYNEITKTYYVLDMMSWKNTPMYETETEFRFFWMAEKMSEIPKLKTITKTNKYIFEVLPNFSCMKENITNMLSAPMNVDLDGLLFYHKRNHYTFGQTPLVTWLKPYMLPEILGIQIPSKYTALKPSSYITFAAHVEQVKLNKEKEEEKVARKEETRIARMEEKKKKRGKKSETSGMDTENKDTSEECAPEVNENLEAEGGQQIKPSEISTTELSNKTFSPQPTLTLDNKLNN